MIVMYVLSILLMRLLSPGIVPLTPRLYPSRLSYIQSLDRAPGRLRPGATHCVKMEACR